MKHMKTLGLLAVAVMALAAIFGTASASAAKFTAGKVGAKLTTETKVNHVFSVTGSNVECKSIAFEGSTEALETESQIVHPSYKECTAFGFAATVNVINCKFTLQSNQTVTLKKTDTINKCRITIVVNNVFAQCEVEVGEQSIAGAVSYSNGAGDINVKVNGSANIADTVLKSSGLCPLTVGSHSNSHYSGESTVKAEGTTITFDA